MSKILEINASTGEEIIRDLTEDEQAALDKAVAIQINLNNKQMADDATKAALLERLGLTADEAKLLLS
jgi:hypothetical protein